jgi:hypothetical protein
MMKGCKQLVVKSGIIAALLLQTSIVTAMALPVPAASDLLRTERFFDLTIHGAPLATKEQCVNYLLRRNPLPAITTSPQQLVELFYQEALLEGIRPDLAFAQALHETGNFGYGGDVVPLQNN